MFTDLETKRLRLKCIDPGDRDFLFEEYRDGFITRYQFDAEPMKHIREADDLIEFYNQEGPRCQNRWVIMNRIDDRKIGSCGFHLWNRESCQVEIGFELLQMYNGQGFMSEAVAAILEFAKIRMKVETIRAVVFVENEKCKRLLERSGFKKTALEECLYRGKVYLHDIYEKNMNP